jgi:xanthine/uracil permease
LLFGMVATAGILLGLMSRVLDRVRVLFPPEVTGLMVAMAGLQLEMPQPVSGSWNPPADNLKC